MKVSVTFYYTLCTGSSFSVLTKYRRIFHLINWYLQNSQLDFLNRVTIRSDWKCLSLIEKPGATVWWSKINNQRLERDKSTTYQYKCNRADFVWLFEHLLPQMSQQKKIMIIQHNTLLSVTLSCWDDLVMISSFSTGLALLRTITFHAFIWLGATAASRQLLTHSVSGRDRYWFDRIMAWY